MKKTQICFGGNLVQIYTRGRDAPCMYAMPGFWDLGVWRPSPGHLQEPLIWANQQGIVMRHALNMETRIPDASNCKISRLSFVVASSVMVRVAAAASLSRTAPAR